MSKAATDRLLALASRLSASPEEAPGLAELAAQQRMSPFQLQRAFRQFAGESPKQYTQRLRLEWAAMELLTTERSVLEIALDAGFNSHEVFTRAFRRQLGKPPARYRAEALVGVPDEVRRAHAAVIEASGPCVGLFHVPVSRRRTMSNPEIIRKELSEQPVLFMRRKVAAHEIASALAACLPRIYAHCQAKGLAMAGPPFCRYVEVGWTMSIEAGIPLVERAPGDGDIEAGTLPGGVAAMAVHVGPYEKLGETHAALEQWAEQSGSQAAGPSWEVYVTDPGEVPDPAEWQTQVYLPLR